MESDGDLIRACRGGDEAAWARLLERYERLVYSVPLSYRLSRDDAADIVQITFTALMTQLDRMPDDSNLAGWLATVARRQTWRLTERSRRDLHETFDAEFEDQLGALGLVGKDPIARWELVEWLDSGLARLGSRCRDLLIALYLGPDEPSYAEISERLAMPIGSIGPTRGRCLEALRDGLAGGTR